MALFAICIPSLAEQIDLSELSRGRYGTRFQVVREAVFTVPRNCPTGSDTDASQGIPCDQTTDGVAVTKTLTLNLYLFWRAKTLGPHDSVEFFLQARDQLQHILMVDLLQHIIR